MTIKFKRLHEDAVIPKLATVGSACVDVVATEISESTDNKVTVHLGFATAIPEGYKAVMAPRSSFNHKGWVLQNSPCQIDADYRGEWMLKFEGLPQHIAESGFYIYPADVRYSEFPYKVGDRVAQVWLEEVIPIKFEEVDKLEETERGVGGFGSTGK